MKAIKPTIWLIVVLIYLSGCSRPGSVLNSRSNVTTAITIAPSVTPTTAAPGSNSAILNETITAPVINTTVTPGACLHVQVTQPPKPVTTNLQPNELDPETGLHMTGLMQWIDLATYRLKVTGLIDRPLSLTYDELRCMPQVTDNPDLVCPGVFTDHATWTGVSIKYILELAGIQQGATKLTLVSADGYEVNLPLETANADKNFLAYEVNGKILPVLHGFPLRAVSRICGVPIGSNGWSKSGYHD
jgi:DMSO/TMAO reductase YedYZ molybdopterin-dependent catalytic subunit